MYSLNLDAFPTNCSLEGVVPQQDVYLVVRTDIYGGQRMNEEKLEETLLRLIGVSRAAEAPLLREIGRGRILNRSPSSTE